MIGDSTYDDRVVYDAVTQRHSGAMVIIQRCSTAGASETPTSQRDQHLQAIVEHGRINWPRTSGYCRRSLIETAPSGSAPA
jgi:hypothetical protein